MSDAVSCPKCDRLQPVPRAAACPGCGLQADRFAGFRGSADADAPPTVAAAWQRCLESWSDETAHDRLAQAAAASGAYRWVARRYREVARDRPDDPVAPGRLAGLGRITEAVLGATASARPERSGRKASSGAMILFAVIFGCIGLGTSLYLVLGHESSAATGKRTRATRVQPPPPVAPLIAPSSPSSAPSPSSPGAASSPAK